MKEEQNIVKVVCEELGITPKELAEKLNIGRSSVSEWSNGSRKIPSGTLLALELLIENHQLKKDLEIIEEFKKILNRTK